MLSEPTYLPARMAAPMVEANFARHRAGSTGDAARQAVPPEAQWIEAVIDGAFWAGWPGPAKRRSDQLNLNIGLVSDFTVFAWSDERPVVHALRIDMLLPL